jgi:hypothetical protein
MGMISSNKEKNCNLQKYYYFMCGWEGNEELTSNCHLNKKNILDNLSPDFNLSDLLPA